LQAGCFPFLQVLQVTAGKKGQDKYLILILSNSGADVSIKQMTHKPLADLNPNR
jgi:hypothetical protein